MNRVWQHVNGRALAVAAAVVLLAATFFVVRGDDEVRTVTAHFPRAVSVYEGSEVRILGVKVGRVTAVVPEGNSVRVEMEYDAEQKLPADAKAAVITPTLVADRFVQLTPAYTGGPVMEDGADIPLPDSGVPVELDRIYSSLRDLSVALGPNGVNRDGTLDHLLRAGARNLEGEGRLGNQMIRNLSAATATFGRGSGDLFGTVTELAKFTRVLGENDRLVRAFIRDLAGVSSALADERVELQRALDAVARSVGTVEGFVRDNRTALVTDLEKLTRVMKTINSERDSLDTVLRVGPLALGNLAVAFNNQTGSIGSRIGLQGTFGNPDGLLCAIVMQSDMPRPSKNLACRIFTRLLEPVAGQTQPSGPPDLPLRLADIDPDSRTVPRQYAGDGAASLDTLIGGGA
ncbi:MCE family protein [Nocardioides sp.]|uniref:MCE family protein n=1 Tax=Nocardioides sp. TaxID=35761 RepID=UPI002D7EB26D|nr:MCE family protein [Nocardioides sp.]HET8960352.1 MCE family protein [Nocardioides sp.]